MFENTGTLTIETERLFLRRFTHEDIPDMLKNWIADPAVQSEYGEPVYKSYTEVKELLDTWTSNYDAPDFYRWAITLRETNENIGQIAFCRVYTDIMTAEVEYCLGKAFWGKGYATEALKAVISYAFSEPQFYKLEAFHRKENPRSGRVLEKTMNRTETVTRFVRENKVHEDTFCYALSKDNY